MTPYFSDDWLTIYQGDVRDVLPTLTSDSVDCIVTSPPYWGLRDYGTGTWSGGEDGHDHIGRELRTADTGGPKQQTKRGSIGVRSGDCECGAVRQDSQIGLERTPEEYVANMVGVFRELRRVLKPSGTCWLNLGSSYMASGGERTYGSYDGATGRGPGTRRNRAGAGGSDPILSPVPEHVPAYGSDGIAPAGSRDPGSACSDLCDECLADWLTHLDRNADTILPPPSDEPLLSLTDRDSEHSDFEQASPAVSPLDVLASTTMRSWLQQRDPCSRCDSRASLLSNARSSSGDAQESVRSSWLNYTSRLKAKDLVPIPWMVAMALQADGWYLRRDVIWAKPNPMPESVTDRPTSAHEYLFLLTKSARYFFDADAVRETLADGTAERYAAGFSNTYHNGNSPGDRFKGPAGFGTVAPAGRNLRSVWTIATRPYPGAHFAVFPPELPERCIKAGSSERGVCPVCGAPWKRQLERQGGKSIVGPKNSELRAQQEANGGRSIAFSGYDDGSPAPIFVTTGWVPTCVHGVAETTREGGTLAYPPRPAVVLDPFAGSGTTGMVANRLSRRAILVDLNGDYLKQQMKRNAQTPLGLDAA